MMKPGPLGLVAFSALLFAAPVAAHHSHAMYDASGEIELEGVLTEVRWANPHVWLYLDVTEADGSTKSWAMEGAAIDQLARKGWERDMLNIGSPIKISCYQLRSGGPGCLGGYVLSLDGEDLPPTHELHAGREFD
jgi:hypothetical protein